MTTIANRTARFDAAMAALPLVAILRGLPAQDADAAADVLFEAGFRLIEVPLNSPQPFDSIATIRRRLPPEVVVGAGTVLTTADVARLADTGADLVVMPHADTQVIAAAVAAGMVCVPGFFTATEAFAARAAGAHALKLFPAEMAGTAAIKALRAVLPRELRVLPVGGITPDNMGAWVAAGAAGFGLGSALYSAGMPMDELGERAHRFVSTWQGLQTN